MFNRTAQDLSPYCSLTPREMKSWEQSYTRLSVMEIIDSLLFVAALAFTGIGCWVLVLSPFVGGEVTVRNGLLILGIGIGSAVATWFRRRYYQ